MEVQETKLLKTDSRAFGEPRNVTCGDQGDTPDDETEVCPTCKGNGYVAKTKHTREKFKLPCAFSESALSSFRSSRRPRVARCPQVHLPSFNEDVTSETAYPVLNMRASQCATTTEKGERNFDETVRRSVMKLSSPEWEVKKEGLEECLQIAQTHPVEIDLHMNQIYRTMRYLVTNHRPRDTLFVCQMARRYFALFRSTCRPEFDQLVVALLVRTADSSLNVRCYVNDALDKMVTYMPTLYALRPLVEKGCQHKNPLVRTATIRLLSDIVTFRTPAALLTHPHLRESCQKIIESGARLLADSCLGTRAAAKDLFSKLVNHEEFDRMFESCSVDSELQKRINKTLSILREHNEEEIQFHLES